MLLLVLVRIGFLVHFGHANRHLVVLLFFFTFYCIVCYRSTVIKSCSYLHLHCTYTLAIFPLIKLHNNYTLIPSILRYLCLIWFYTVM